MLADIVDPSLTSSTHVELLRWRATHQPDRTAYIFLADGEEEEIRITYAELDRWASRIAALLQAHCQLGDRALLLYPPSLEYLKAFYGCLYAGVIAVPTYPPRANHNMQRVEAIIHDAQPSIVLTTTTLLSTATLRKEFAHLSHLEQLHKECTDILAPELSASWREPVLSDQTLAFLQYTSGSTGMPKGVMVSHGNLLYNHQMLQSGARHPADAYGVSWLPLYHDMGLIGHALQAVYVGATCVLMSPFAFLQRPVRWLSAITRYRAHSSTGPNFAFELCAQKITERQKATLDLSCWKVAGNGSEPIHPQCMERFAQAFQSCGFQREAFAPNYGLAEATLYVTGRYYSMTSCVQNVHKRALEQGRVVPVDPYEPDATFAVSCGPTTATLGQKILIVDPQTRMPCPADQVGEVWIAGPHIAQGYWRRDEQTQQTFRAYLASNHEGPFMRTGDLGFILHDELFIKGRLKDLIIIDGKNHYPQDIEKTVEDSHPAFRPGGCAAFSIEANGRELLVVAVEVERRYRSQPVVDERQLALSRVAAGGGQASSLQVPADLFLSKEQLVKAIRKAVAEEHEVKVYAVEFLKAGSLLKTSSGKIQRRACKQGFLEHTLDVWGE